MSDPVYVKFYYMNNKPIVLDVTGIEAIYMSPDGTETILNVKENNNNYHLSTPVDEVVALINEAIHTREGSYCWVSPRETTK